MRSPQQLQRPWRGRLNERQGGTRGLEAHLRPTRLERNGNDVTGGDLDNSRIHIPKAPLDVDSHDSAPRRSPNAILVDFSYCAHGANEDRVHKPRGLAGGPSESLTHQVGADVSNDVDSGSEFIAAQANV